MLRPYHAFLSNLSYTASYPLHTDYTQVLCNALGEFCAAEPQVRINPASGDLQGRAIR
jgi:hypothetical protein